MTRYSIIYTKTKYWRVEVEAQSQETAIELANETEEKFGELYETPYFLEGVHQLADVIESK